MSVGVAYRGHILWQEGFGFADVENAIPMTPFSVVRIASISKPIAGLLAISLVEKGKLDLEKNVRDYIPEFPEKIIDGQVVKVTTTHLMSHTSGIRHYQKKEEIEAEPERKQEFANREYYIKDHFNSVFDALALFKNDPLLHAPGEDFTYTTHGYTLLSAIIERAGGAPFEEQLRRMLRHLELWDTHLEENDRMTTSRGRHYARGKNGLLTNVPYVDNSYKWAGGGLVSNVPDLLRFGSYLLTIYSSSETAEDGLVSRQMLDKAWTAVPNTKCKWLGESRDNSYGLGWGLFRHRSGYRYIAHTGGAIGGTSVLILVPEFQLTVVILCNVQDGRGVGFSGKRIADCFVDALIEKGSLI